LKEFRKKIINEFSIKEFRKKPYDVIIVRLRCWRWVWPPNNIKAGLTVAVIELV